MSKSQIQNSFIDKSRLKQINQNNFQQLNINLEHQKGKFLKIISFSLFALVFSSIIIYKLFFEKNSTYCYLDLDYRPQCRKCPENAECSNGEILCDYGYKLETHGLQDRFCVKKDRLEMEAEKLFLNILIQEEYLQGQHVCRKEQEYVQKQLSLQGIQYATGQLLINSQRYTKDEIQIILENMRDFASTQSVQSKYNFMLQPNQDDTQIILLNYRLSLQCQIQKYIGENYFFISQFGILFCLTILPSIYFYKKYQKNQLAQEIYKYYHKLLLNSKNQEILLEPEFKFLEEIYGNKLNNKIIDLVCEIALIKDNSIEIWEENGKLKWILNKN